MSETAEQALLSRAMRGYLHFRREEIDGKLYLRIWKGTSHRREAEVRLLVEGNHARPVDPETGIPAPINVPDPDDPGGGKDRTMYRALISGDSLRCTPTTGPDGESAFIVEGKAAAANPTERT